VITGQARDAAAGVTVEVGPGGGLRSITLTERSLRLGGEALAAAILSTARIATAHANQRARHALPEALAGLGDAELAALGLGVDPDLADAVEQTTPDTWMR